MADVTSEVCENCGRQIGKLETPMVWKERVVCGDCYGRLSASAPNKPEFPGTPCGICGNLITAAEPAYVINGMAACRGCYRRKASMYVVSGRAAADAPPAPTHCANCEEPFGKLEKPRIYNGHSVCIACYNKIYEPEPKFTCARCGHQGEPGLKKKNSNATKVLSLGVFGPLGLVSALDNEKIPCCPKCGWDGTPWWRKNIL